MKFNFDIKIKSTPCILLKIGEQNSIILNKKFPKGVKNIYYGIAGVLYIEEWEEKKFDANKKILKN